MTTDKKQTGQLINIIFAVILAAFCFVGVNRGIDITDSGYNLGNFTYLEGLDGMWFYSTLFANFLGKLIVLLPFGNTMLGAGIYLRLLRAVFIVWLYFFFVKKVQIGRPVSLAGCILALAMCWAPTYGVYHYLGYYLFAIAIALLYTGLEKEKDQYLFVAGVVLGINVFVRLPNICEAALIIAVWWYLYTSGRKFGEICQKTGACVLGFCLSIGIVFIGLLVTGHVKDYFSGLGDLFTMSGEDERYGVWFTIRNLIDSYTCVWYWLIPVALAAIALFVLGFFPKKFKILYHGLAVAGMGVVYLWFYKTRLFDYNFRSYSSMYLFGVVILIVCIFLLLAGTFGKSFSPGIKMLCVSSLVSILVTPLGTNNSLYCVLNNMFILFPMAIYVAVKLGEKQRLYVLRTGILTLLSLYVAQMIAFGCIFTFREKQPPQTAKVTNNSVMQGMKTSKELAAFYETVGDIWEEKNLREAEILTFGDVPGFAYYYGSKPALSSTWPSLNSYSNEKFEVEMKELAGRMRDKGAKVVCVTDFYLDKDGKKQEILKNFLSEYEFESVYSDLGYTIWLQKEK